MVGVVLLVYFILNLSCSDGAGTFTWYDPPPIETTTDNTVFRTSNTQLTEGYANEELHWKFSFAADLDPIFDVRVKLNGVQIVSIIPSLKRIQVLAGYEGRFNLSWINDEKVTLIIFNVTDADEGEFACEVTTVGWTIKTWIRKIKVDIVVPPKLIKVSQDQTVLEGSNVQLTCEASGKPAPNITWTMVFRNGNDSDVLHRGSTWNMVNIKRTNSGKYRCTAYNGVGNADAFVVNINITYPAEIIKAQNSTVQVGGYATLICQSEGNPSPLITWTRYKTNEIIGYGSTFVLCSVQFSDGGWYTCSSANSLGNDRASVYLEVIEKRITLINVTMTISNEEYHEDIERLGSERSLHLVSRVKEAVKTVFQGDSRFENTDVVALRPGSVIVSFVLTFKAHVTVGHAISMLKAVAESGNLGAFKVNGSSIVATEKDAFKSTPTTNTPVQVCSECSCNCSLFIAVVVILVAVIIVLIIYVIWLHKTVARRKERTYQESSDEKTAVQMSGLDPNLKEARQQETQGCSRGQYMELDEARRLHNIPGTSQTNTSQVSQYAPLHPSTLSWEIPREHVKNEKVIGKGAFGQVAKGTALGLRGMPHETLVAVKMLKADAPETDKKDLLSELEVMKTLKPHPHVIKLLGCVTESEPLLVLIEYVPYGDLLGYLRKSRGLNDTYYKDPDIKPQTSLTSQQLIKFAWQITDGMSYLSSRSIIHRDLAARNVLIGERETCKVTDFGMARDVQQENIYEKKTKGRLPVKWTAYEALLYGKYTTKSDIWSYGVLLYEIFTIGGSPYPRMDGRKIASLLQGGYRMPKPQHVDDELYKIMMMCWQKEPDARPTFVDLRNKLKKMDKQKKNYINMRMYDTQLYANVEDLVV